MTVSVVLGGSVRAMGPGRVGGARQCFGAGKHHNAVGSLAPQLECTEALFMPARCCGLRPRPHVVQEDMLDAVLGVSTKWIQAQLVPPAGAAAAAAGPCLTFPARALPDVRDAEGAGHTASAYLVSGKEGRRWRRDLAEQQGVAAPTTVHTALYWCIVACVFAAPLTAPCTLDANLPNLPTARKLQELRRMSLGSGR